MAAAIDQLALDFDGGQDAVASAARESSRTEVVSLVEYSPFPRVSRDAQNRIGYTRDENASGLCLGAESAERVGTLLRVVVRGVDGRATLDSIARVVWCLPRDDGRFWIGLSLVVEGQRQMQTVRRIGRTRRIDVTA